MMKNLKVNAKLTVSFGIILLMLIFSSGVAIVSMTIMGQQIKEFSNQTVPNTGYVWQMRRDMVSIERNLLAALIEEKESNVNQYLESAEKDAENVYSIVESLSKNSQIEKNVFTELNSNLDDLSNVRAQITEKLRNGQDKQAYDLYLNKYQPIFENSSEIFINISDSEIQFGEEHSTTASRILYGSLIILILTMVISVIVTLLVIKAIKIVILTPIQEINSAAQILAQGNLHAEIAYESRDELGQLADAMRVLMNTVVGIIKDLDYGLSEIGNGNFTVESKAEDLFVGEFLNLRKSMERIISQLSNALSNINQASEQVAIGSEQVSSGAQELSQGASEQAASIEEMLSMMNKISEHIKRNAEDAHNGKLNADEVEHLVVQSNDLMKQMIDAMSEISNTSSEIGKIIKSIDDIAFQTNILALNAAVEAARAGEAGKGFAVVADEVRNLAGKSAESAKNTAELIESSISAVENGVQIVKKTADSLDQVVHKTEDVNVVIDKIARSSEEQASSITQVTQAIDQISQVVQTNSATAEESAAASEELSSQSNFLKNLVSQFQLQEVSSVNYKEERVELNERTEPCESYESVQNRESKILDGKYE